MIQALVILICSFSTLAHAGLGKVVGQLGLVEGEVYVDSKLVQKNAPVREGSVVEVKQGRATVLVGKGSVFNLGADSKMVVSEYHAKTDVADEGAELDLKFGRTRALILNQGGEKKDIRIKARAATMGVRGTEVFIDVPKDSAKPVQFFTLEGKADVIARPGAPVVPLPQNQGIATSSGAQSTGTQTSALTVTDLKNQMKKEGLDLGTSPVTVATTVAAPPPGSVSSSLSIGSLPPIQFDPIADSAGPLLNLRPRFCNAAIGCH